MIKPAETFGVFACLVAGILFAVNASAQGSISCIGTEGGTVSYQEYWNAKDNFHSTELTLFNNTDKTIYFLVRQKQGFINGYLNPGKQRTLIVPEENPWKSIKCSRHNRKEELHADTKDNQASKSECSRQAVVDGINGKIGSTNRINENTKELDTILANNVSLFEDIARGLRDLDERCDTDLSDLVREFEIKAKFTRKQRRDAARAEMAHKQHQAQIEGLKRQQEEAQRQPVAVTPPSYEGGAELPAPGALPRGTPATAANCDDSYFEREAARIKREGERRLAKGPGAGELAVLSEWIAREGLALYENGQNRCGRDFSPAIDHFRRMLAAAQEQKRQLGVYD